MDVPLCQKKKKISLGIAEGKKKVDKREVIKKRDWDREKHRLLKNNN